jgi:hypothetical protein
MAAPRSWLIIGPSTASMREDTRDPAPAATGTGFFARAAADLNMAFQYVTRTGAYFSRISSNEDAVSLFPFVDGAILWVGNNEQLGGGGTPAQQVEVLTAVYDQLVAAGVTWFIVFPTMPRSSSSDSWATAANQSHGSEAGANGLSVELARGIAEFARARSNVILLPFPDLRSPTDYLLWNGATPGLTPDGLHFSPSANVIAAADVVAAINTYINDNWPTLQANMALACAA